jgi:hypothetical protein
MALRAPSSLADVVAYTPASQMRWMTINSI